MSAPALRFKQFSDVLVETLVSDFAPLQRGFDLPVNDIVNGKFPVVFSNGILKHHKEFKALAPGVVTGRSGTIGSVTYIEENYWPHNTSLWVTDFKSNLPKFVYYFYNQFDLTRFATGSGVPTLNRNDVHRQKVFIPALPEQTKIADFLTAVDEKLSQLTQKCELLTQYKKGVMQQIFSQALRFKDEDGREFPGWEEKALRDIGSFFSGGTPLTTRKDFYGGAIRFIKSGELGASSTAQAITELGLMNSSAKMVKAGDLLYALYGATSGELAISKIEGAINQAILCIRTNLNTYYLYSQLLFQKQSILDTYLQGGQGNLSAEIIKSLVVPVPSKKEQTKIANFLTAIDDKITNTQAQLAITKQYKQGLLQQMFV